MAGYLEQTNELVHSPKLKNFLSKNYWFLKKNSAPWSEWVSAWIVLFGSLFMSEYVKFTDGDTQMQSDATAPTHHHIMYF